MNLPEMIVEARNSTTAHGIETPNIDRDFLALQAQEAIQLNEDAKSEGWSDTTIEILQKYLPVGASKMEIIWSLSNVSKFKSWRESTLFVQDDMCLEYFNKALKYCLREGQPHRKNKGFIDGSGIGYVKVYTKRLKQTLEQAFDAKYYYQVSRPLEYIQSTFGMDLSSVANKLHPGHWSYPAGHGTKFLTAVEVLNEVFALDSKCYRALLIDACVNSMARSGSLIHYPMDNLAGGKLTNLKEFK